MTAHAEPSTLHTKGTRDVAQIIMPAMIAIDAPKGNQNLDRWPQMPRQLRYMVQGHREVVTNRFAIFGISLKKFDRSTSFTVADHWMLYENRCAKIACDTGIDRPPKKKKLALQKTKQSDSLRECENNKTHKNGIQSIFSKNAYSWMEKALKLTSPSLGRTDVVHTSFLWPRRYSSRVYPIVPDPQNTTVVARKISKLCMKKPSTGNSKPRST